MSIVSAASPANTATPAAQTAAASAQQFSRDYNTFLKMLTTQLKNQDPLEPMDTKDFTQQLVQYSSVEQSIRANDKLEKILATQQSNATSAALGYLGKTVDAQGDQVLLKDGEADFQFMADKKSAKVSVAIADKLGRTVRTLVGPTAQGLQNMTWDGRDQNGIGLPQGYYTLKVTSYDTSDNPTTLSTLVSGTVTGVGDENGEIMLTVNDLPIKASKIVAVRSPDANS
jgi:flagellar basal-body rod modification protein FlgD